MCGILGVYALSDSILLPAEQKLRKALSYMHHRGPDAEDTYMVDHKIALGHVRLSIIDLSPDSNQPFHYGDYTLVFNGEIYNYQEIRAELQQLGYTFRTQSDTEVLVAAYQAWGSACLLRFNGMWAFGIFNHSDQSLFLARDRFGVKPLYYHADENALYFSSCIKSLLELKPSLRKPNLNAIAGYCRESVGGESLDTWFEGIHRLAPAHYCKAEHGAWNQVRYWDYPVSPATSLSFADAQVAYRTLFEDAVKLRMRSDVPVGATLSAGIDSQSVVAVAQQYSDGPLRTYTAHFPEEEYDEFKWVREWQEHQNHTTQGVSVSYDDFMPQLRQLIYHLEGGHSSPAIFPLSKVLKRAKQDVTVFLEGQGADELLGGYINAVFIDHLLDVAKGGNWRKAWQDLMSFQKNWSLKYAFLLFLRTSLPSSLRTAGRSVLGTERVYGEKLRHYTPARVSSGPYQDKLKQRLYEQHTGGLVNLLYYGDIISMKYSLESRLPFMDYRLVEFVFGLSAEYLVRDGMGKYLHRQAMQGLVKDVVLKSRAKIGFKSPFETIFKEPDLQDYILNHPVVTIANWFEREALGKLYGQVISGQKNQHRFLFRVLCVALWYDIYIHAGSTVYETKSTSTFSTE